VRSRERTILGPSDLHNVNAPVFVQVLIAALAAGGLVWFIVNRTGKFKHWIKEELMGDTKFIEAIGEEVEKRIRAAFHEHEIREVQRSIEFEQRVERRLLSFGSHLTILEGKIGLVESKLDSKPPKNNREG